MGEGFVIGGYGGLFSEEDNDIDIVWREAEYLSQTPWRKKNVRVTVFKKFGTAMLNIEV